MNPLKVFRNNKVGLVLGSGGSKGISMISIIEYLETIEIPIDLIVGSSIGSIVGAIYANGKLLELKEELLKLKKNDMHKFFDPVIPRSGFLEGKKATTFFEKFIGVDQKIEDLPIPLAICATDYYTSKCVVFTKGNLLQAIRASFSIPGVFEPVKYKNTWLLDGGVANPLPIDVALKMGAGLTIAVNLHPMPSEISVSRLNFLRSGLPSHYSSKKFNLLIDAEDVEKVDLLKVKDLEIDNSSKKIFQRFFDRADDLDKQMPSVFEILGQTIDIMGYVNTILNLKNYKPTVLIEPQLLDMQTMEFTSSTKALAEGYLACTKVRKDLLRKIKFWV